MAIDAALGRLGNKSGVCTSSTRPTNPFEGQLIYETDTNRTLVYDNAAWLVVADNQVLSIDPANSRVGIGTTTPAADLDVRGGILAHGSTGSNVGTEVGAITINNNSADGTVDFTQGLVFTDNVNGAGPWTHAGIAATGSSGFNGSLVFGTDGDSANNTTGIVERMRINSSGNVGINDTSPSYTLDVNGDINATGEVRTNGNPVGLVHIKSVSVPSGSGSITVTGITGYVDYLLRFDRVDCSGNAVLIIDSADLSAFQWYGNALLWQGTATPLAYDLGGASSAGAYAGFIGTNRSSLLLHIFNPNSAGRTRYYSQGVYSTAHFHAGGVYNADTTTDQFTFSMSGSNTLSGGTIEVYGYNQ